MILTHAGRPPAPGPPHRGHRVSATGPDCMLHQDAAGRRPQSARFCLPLDSLPAVISAPPIRPKEIVFYSHSPGRHKDLRLFLLTDRAKEFLLSEGIDYRYGARHLKRAIERLLVYPLSTLSATSQVRLGDVVRIDVDRQTQKLVFFRDRSEVSVAAAALESARRAGAEISRRTLPFTCFNRPGIFGELTRYTPMRVIQPRT